MSIQITTPVKGQIKYPYTNPQGQVDKQLKRVDSEEAIIPVTKQQLIENRLRENARIIQMINSNRFERSRSRRKEVLDVQEPVSIDQTLISNKKEIIGEIVSKLDSALRESKRSLEHSGNYRSESKELQQKVRAFENSLKQVKQTNIEAQNKINQIKSQISNSRIFQGSLLQPHNQLPTPAFPPSNSYFNQKQRESQYQRQHQILNHRSLNRYNERQVSNQLIKSKSRNRDRDRDRDIEDRTKGRYVESRRNVNISVRLRTQYQVKGHYVYPKYIKPQRDIGRRAYGKQ